MRNPLHATKLRNSGNNVLEGTVPIAPSLDSEVCQSPCKYLRRGRATYTCKREVRPFFRLIFEATEIVNCSSNP
eukprot:3357441-Amphidinium_carterae.1